MKLDIYQADAFTSKVFGGNPAALVPLDEWLPDQTLLNIAIENNLSETAFTVPQGDKYHLRWFTPGGEVQLCGHATLATAYIMFEELDYEGDVITFSTLSGDLFVHKTNIGLMMDFPIWEREEIDTPEYVIKAFGKEPIAYFKGNDDMAVFDDPTFIRRLQPDLSALKDGNARGVLVTAPGDEHYDFISRAFFPKLCIDEDPVTGSAHCILTPYWAQRLNKNKLVAHQASKRGGDLLCELKGDRVEITGQAAMYMKGEIYV
ncbi:MAG: PhzF family phenazine biosynthesis protein [Alphaproteobacteria bacterium]|nr:PhzF family phenazine biosynthesis protein [Alphaproteobacteria bacterium]